MNAERLLQLYDRVSEAPDAIPRLRRFILDLAVRGKLVEQDLDDEPASAYLKKISAEERSVGKKKRSRGSTSRPNAGVSAQEFHELPETWAWTEVGDVFFYDAGIKRAPKDIDQGLWLLELEDVEKDTGRLINRLKVGDRESKSTKSEFRIGDILYGKLRPYLNKVLVADEPGVSTTEIVAIRPILPLCSAYCALAFRRPGFVEYVTRLGQGTKMPRLRTEDAIVAPFPLPPVPEQRRIVAKVDDLMALCDGLEAERERREANRDRLTTASLTRLTAPDVDEQQFKAHADFAIKVLPELTTRPDQIKVLRQTILDLAVRGKLVEQDPNDEPAKDLLRRICAERDRLIKSKAIKGSSFDSSGPKDIPFELSPSWCWTRLGAIGDWGSGSTPSRGNAELFGGGITWLKSGELNDSMSLAGSEETVTEAAVKRGSFRINQPGDVLIAMYGATIGKLAILAETAVTNQAVCGCTPFAGVFNRFLFLFLLSQREVLRKASEGGAQPNISKVKIVNTPFPLPPLIEQHRIVAKVDELMAHCDQLEQALHSGRGIASSLLEVLLVEALGPLTMEAA